uniref:Uncharacterized protein n=1 Tax=Marseillevirus LCMAC201 TaxID=2506605 RepID=A0A481YXA3_9VIRU|nr:MAG: hypothetical protein LCMAC201_04420 [Marseillevirus LCMAC201]
MDRFHQILVDRNLKFHSTGDMREKSGLWRSSVALRDHEENVVYEIVSKQLHSEPGHYDMPANILCDSIEEKDIRCEKPPKLEEMNCSIVD